MTASTPRRFFAALSLRAATTTATTKMRAPAVAPTATVAVFAADQKEDAPGDGDGDDEVLTLKAPLACAALEYPSTVRLATGSDAKARGAVDESAFSRADDDGERPAACAKAGASDTVIA